MVRLSLVLATALSVCWPSSASAQDDESVARLRELHAEGRYGEALDEVARLDDAVLAAEWRCFLAFAAGDYPAALAATRAGLEIQPEHRGLLVNAIHVTLALGLGAEALERAQALSEALARSRPPAQAEELERAARLLESATAQRELELASQSRLSRAQVAATAGLGLCIGALLALALRPIRPARAGS